MKYNIIKSLLVFSIGASLLSTGCRKLEDFGDTDTRLDQPAKPTTSNLLTSAEVSVPNVFSSTAGGIRGNYIANNGLKPKDSDVSLYGNPQLDFGGTYTGPLENLQYIIDLNSGSSKSDLNVLGSSTAPLGSNGSQMAIATILKVYYLWTLTDRWGDIPYTEALKLTANLTPKYDKQEDIYPKMLSDLKAAIGMFDNSNAVRGDLYYPVATSPAIATPASIDNQILSWTKVANSMRMLIALRMSKRYPNAGDLAATEFADAASQPAIESNSENMTLQFPGTSVFETNVFYSALNGRKDYAFSKTLGDILATTNLNDRRRNAFATTGADFPYGLPRELAVAFDGSVAGNYSKPFAASYRAANSPVVILPAAYVLLAKAEAVQRGWITGSAETYYNDGVSASFEQWGQGSATAYLAGAANFNTGSGGGSNIGNDPAFPSISGSDANTSGPLQRIQLQRYIASFGDGVQAWSEWRRTGVPNLKPTQYATNSPKEIPRRLTYGTSEYAANPTNVAEAASRYPEGDVMNARVWWDQ